MKKAFFIMLFFFLGGCAITYTHPTKNSQEFERDRRECEAMAMKNLSSRGIATDCDAVVGKETMKCLETQKGWRRTN